MALNIDATFEEKLTCAFKNGMRNLANFHESMFESLKTGNKENNQKLYHFSGLTKNDVNLQFSTLHSKIH